MKPEANPDRETEALGAFLAPLAGIGTFVILMVFSFAAFSNDKTAMPLSFFFAATVGIYVGSICYKNSQPSNDGWGSNASDKRDTSAGSKLWALGLAVQCFVYFAICTFLGSHLRLVPRHYGTFLWTGLNCFVGLSMVISLASVFWLHWDVKNRLIHLFWTIVLFAVLYASFIYAATWLADPYTIPGKLEW